MLNWLEIDAAALIHNIGEFRQRLEAGTRLGAVVKSNAYGHGMSETARIARQAGADWLCVNNIDEAVALDDAGLDLPVLIMGYVDPDRLEQVVRRDLRPVVYNLETLDRLAEHAERLDREVRLHVKLETGTHRQGVVAAAIPAFVARLADHPRLVLEGVTTHFANIEDTTSHGFAEAQMNLFNDLADELARGSGRSPIRHTACSAAAILFSRTHLGMARIGISLYGLWPSRETYVSCLERGRPKLDLRPVMSWKTRIIQVKEVAEGEFVGYGCTHRTTRASRIAVLPVGYYEGYDRGLSGVAHVLVRGRRAPVVGRVCMNMCMVDVTDVQGVALEDEVVLIGSQGNERIGAEKLAEWCGTISYEIVSRIHPALPRVVVGG